MSVRLLGFLCSVPTDDFWNLTSAWQVMNEVALHRGSSPHLNTIDIFVDGQHLTEAVVNYYCVCFFSCPSSFGFSSQTVSLFRLQQAQLRTRYQREAPSSILH
jgi:hypothetical protein